MNKKFKISILAIFLISMMVLTCIPIQAAPNSSFIVYGRIKVGANYQNGKEVTITNEDTGEYITTTSETDDFGHEGYYSANLGNLETQWQRGDNITVSFVHGTTRSEDFEIPNNGTMYKQDISVGAGGGGGRRERGVGITGSLVLPIFLMFFIIIGIALYIYGTQNGGPVIIPPAGKRRKKDKKKK